MICHRAMWRACCSLLLCECFRSLFVSVNVRTNSNTEHTSKERIELHVEREFHIKHGRANVNMVHDLYILHCAVYCIVLAQTQFVAMDTIVRVSPFEDGAKIMRTLGQGAYGKVVLARDSRGNCPERCKSVVLKIHKHGKNKRKNILWEAGCLRRVAHAHIIQLIDVRAETKGGEEEPSDLPIFVFPQADTDLATFLNRSHGGVLPTALARRMMGQLASALAHIHFFGIIHRDVKPANCLIFFANEVHGEFLVPALVLADFGMARCMSEELCRRHTTNRSQRVMPMTAMVCTAWYRPPELWAVTMDDQCVDFDSHNNLMPYGPSLDVWSYGAVVYETLRGEILAGRAGNGLQMVKKVAEVIGACPCPGQGFGVLEYIQHKRWRSWAAAIRHGRIERRLPKSGAEWALVERCLRWDPSARVTMASAKQCAWFAEQVAIPEAAPTSQPGTPPCLDVRHNVSGASMLSTTSLLTLPPSKEQAQIWLGPDLSPLATTFKSSNSCACKGHCRLHKHRTEGKCDCTELVIDTGYCNICKCIVTGCSRPKSNSDFCHKHKVVFGEAPFSIRLAIAAVPVAPLLVPCDVVHYISVSALIQDDVAMLILTAAIKEPLAVGELVEAWKQLPKQYSGSMLRSAVLRAIAVSHCAPHSAQLTQLHRGRMGLFFGLIATAINLGIIRQKRRLPASPQVVNRAAKPAGAAQQTYRLGNSFTEYEVLDPSASKCDKFLEATRAEEHVLASECSTPQPISTPGTLDDLVDYGSKRAKAALQRIATKSGALPFSADDASGYCIDFLIRKLVAARIFRQKLHNCDWSCVDKASLQSMSADAKKNLEHIPDSCNARDISCILTGHANWGLFASMFPCLWGEVADKLSTKDDLTKALKIVQSQDFLRTVQSYRKTNGIAPHPAVAYQLTVNLMKPTPSKKRKRCDLTPQKKHASTMRKKRKAE